MKKLITMCFLFISAAVFAHAPLLSVDDNNDGTIYIEAGFSNGEKAEGMEFIIVKDKPYNGPEDTYEGKITSYLGVKGFKITAELFLSNFPLNIIIFPS